MLEEIQKYFNTKMKASPVYLSGFRCPVSYGFYFDVVTSSLISVTARTKKMIVMINGVWTGLVLITLYDSEMQYCFWSPS